MYSAWFSGNKDTYVVFCEADFPTSGAGFHSRQLLRQGVGYGNLTYKAVITWTY